MSEVKWIKIAIGMPDDEKIKLMDALENRDLAHYVLLRLLIQAGKTNAKGRIFLSETIPYTNEMLAIIFNRPVDAIKSVLKLLVDLKIIEIDKDNFIRIVNWEKHQNVEGMERVREQNRKRAERFRNKNKVNVESENTTRNTNNESVSKEEDSYEDEKSEEKEISDHINSNVTVTMQRENENKIENKIENKSDRHTDNNTAEEILEYVKKISGKAVKMSLAAINDAVSIHGAANVKLAIDRAVEVKKVRMNYIKGILKNWQLEGYPVSDSNYDNSYKVQGRKLSFINFEPRKYDYDALEKALLGWNE